MKQLSRKKIQDMIDLNGANISSRRSSGGSGAGGGGGVSSAWVDEHYVSKDFFARLFTINGTDENDDDVVVEPNDLETTITNIQAMVGLWTEEYLSALGQDSGGGGGGGALLTEPLASINEAGMGTPSSPNQVLAWDGVHWTYKPYTTGNGTVTSIRIAVPMGFSVNPSTAITTSGTFTISFARGTLGNGVVLATPSSGTGDPIWRALVADDIPSLAASKITSGTFDAARIPNLSWTKITSDKPTTLLGYGISDAKIENGVITLGHATITPLTDAKLKNDYEWWGAKLDSTTGKREGNMSNVGNISFSESGKNIGSIAYFDTNNTRLGIGAPPGAYLLDVAGRTKTTRLYLADDVYLVYDSSNGGVHIVGAGLYTDTYVSALGAGSGGGSGSGITMNDVWDALAATAPSASSQQIDLTHLTTALSSYASKTWVQSQGYISSADMSNYVKQVIISGQQNPLPKSNGIVTFPNTISTFTNDASYLSLNTSVSVPNLVLASPNGSGGLPSFRSLLAADIPDLSATYATVSSLSSYVTQVIGQGETNPYPKASGIVTIPKVPTKTSDLFNDSGFVTTDTKNTAGGDQNSALLYLVGMPSQTTGNGSSRTYTKSACYIGTDNCLYSNGSKVLTSTSGLVTTDTAQTISGTKTFSSIEALTFTNGASNRVFSINNNGAIKLDVANVGASNGWETGYFAKSGNTYIGCLGLFGVGTALDYAFIGKGYDNTWLRAKSNGNVGIGNIDPLYKLHVDGTCYINGNTSINGTINNLTISTETPSIASAVSSTKVSSQSNKALWCYSDTLLYASGNWINTSDVRKKDIFCNVEARVKQIADAPIFNYRMKGAKNEDLFLGTSAQFWQTIFPTAVKEMPDGFLGLDYAATALAAAVMTARKVMTHEEQIAALNRRIVELESEIKQLKAA